VTVTPTGKVKLHQVSENGIFFLIVRSVSAAASTAHIIANPQTGTPKRIEKMAMPDAIGAATAR
jgi:hypothetical protein